MCDKSPFVRRKPDKKFLPKCFKHTIKHPTKVMIGSVISTYGNSSLHNVQGNLIQHEFNKVLQIHLVRQKREWYLNNDGIFMHDGAPGHRLSGARVGNFVDILTFLSKVCPLTIRFNQKGLRLCLDLTYTVSPLIYITVWSIESVSKFSSILAANHLLFRRGANYQYFSIFKNTLPELILLRFNPNSVCIVLRTFLNYYNKIY